MDIKRLEEAFPVAELTEGRMIEHDALSAVLDQKRGTSRYYGVIDSWRVRAEGHYTASREKILEAAKRGGAATWGRGV